MVKTLSPNNTAESLFDWFSRYGIAPVWVSDRGSHFLNEVVKILAQRLHASHHFTLAYCPWANGSIEIINKHILSVIRALLSEFRWPYSDWPYLVPLLRYVLNHTTPENRPAAITLFMGLNPSSHLDSVWNPRLSKLVSIPLTPSQLQEKLSQLKLSLLAMHKSVTDNRDRRRRHINTSRKAEKANFSVGDFILVSNVLKRSKSKLSVRWSGPHRIAKVYSDHVFMVEHLVTGICSDVHGSRLRFYCDSSLHITEELVEQVASDGDGYEIDRILEGRWNSKAQAWAVLVAWRGFEEMDCTWEPLLTLYDDAPVFVKRCLSGLSNRTELLAALP
jgi:hypothetical protein